MTTNDNSSKVKKDLATDIVFNIMMYSIFGGLGLAVLYLVYSYFFGS